jgi:GMP synthase-like glutamine amidotransferase
MTRVVDELELCVIDMNGGAANRAIGNLRALIAPFFADIRRLGLEGRLRIVAPRARREPIPVDCDLYVASGGPGSPLEGDGHRWGLEFRTLVERLLERRGAAAGRPQRLFAICFSFELLVHQLALGALQPAQPRVAGVWPVTHTPFGRGHPLLGALPTPFSVLEVREWMVSEVAGSLGEHPVRVLASAAGPTASTRAVLEALSIGESIEAVQFHPEADPREVAQWLASKECARSIVDEHGAARYAEMIRAASATDGLPRTHSCVVPEWLVRSFNAIAAEQGWPRLGSRASGGRAGRAPKDPGSGDLSLQERGTAPYLTGR